VVNDVDFTSEFLKYCRENLAKIVVYFNHPSVQEIERDQVFIKSYVTLTLSSLHFFNDKKHFIEVRGLKMYREKITNLKQEKCPELWALVFYTALFATYV